MKPKMVPPHQAHQHLNRDGKPRTLCGYAFEDIYAPKVYDHRDGFDPNGGPACATCADAADAIQNGAR